MSILSDSPETSQRSPLYLLDPETKHEAHNNKAMQQITMSYFLPFSL